MSIKGKRTVPALFLALCLLFLGGCGAGQSSASPAATASESAQTETPAEKTVVAVTIVPEQTFVQAVCGDLAEVIAIGSSREQPRKL
jgi:zinc transport system substrate-binding protein